MPDYFQPHRNTFYIRMICVIQIKHLISTVYIYTYNHTVHYGGKHYLQPYENKRRQIDARYIKKKCSEYWYQNIIIIPSTYRVKMHVRLDM